MRFFFLMFGRDMGDLQVFLHHEKRTSETFVWARYKNQGTQWHSANATVYGYNGRHFNVRNRGYYLTALGYVDIFSTRR